MSNGQRARFALDRVLECGFFTGVSVDHGQLVGNGLCPRRRFGCAIGSPAGNHAKEQEHSKRKGRWTWSRTATHMHSTVARAGSPSTLIPTPLSVLSGTCSPTADSPIRRSDTSKTRVVHLCAPGD